ncbi:MAG TPA: MBL fold metallo-hydrolase [Marmoricola sp.]
MRMRWGRPDLERYAGLFERLDGLDGGGLRATFGGVSTVLIDDGSSGVLFDGFFSRPSLLRVAGSRIGPDDRRVADGLRRIGASHLARLEAVVPVHSHFDHALDSAEVARRTGALLVGGGSTANLGRGAGLAEAAIRTATPGAPISLGTWTLTLTESTHCPPDRFPGVIETPVTTPARVSAWRCGEAWSAHLHHDSGATVLVQGSAGFVPGALDATTAEVVYLGVGQLGIHPDSYLRDYWEHVVRACGAHTAVLTHWDDFFVPADRPLRANAYAVDDLDHTITVLGELADADGVRLAMPTIWSPQDPWTR